MSAAGAMRVAFAGEALIDFTGSGGLAFQGHCGGSPLNAAVACARLGQATGYLTQLSTDLFGAKLLSHLQTAGIDTRFIVRSDAPSTVAFVERGPQTNRYAFYARGSAARTPPRRPLPMLPDSCRFLHFGSISLLQEPASSHITRLIETQGAQRIVVFDPNVRLSLIDDLPAYRARFAQWLACTDLLKLSDEDVAALAPGLGSGEAAAIWLQSRPRAVVVTHGANGAVLYRAGQPPLAMGATSVAVVDSIGAGDTFTAGLSVALSQCGIEQAAALESLSDADWSGVLRFAAMAAALNCTREGADPPTLAQVQVALGQTPDGQVADNVR